MISTRTGRRRPARRASVASTIWKPCGEYSCPTFPGWDLAIPDQVRADAFLKELAEFERQGTYPDFVILYLPNDHTGGELKAQSYLADNDLALGRCVEGLSKSRFWKDLAIFVIEDDPQSGHDHVDGHRSICFVASPWAKRGAVVSKFYSENAVLHTIGRILGLPPLNQIGRRRADDGGLLSSHARPDALRVPCAGVPARRAQVGPVPSPRRRPKRNWPRGLPPLISRKPDLIDEDALNRAVWMETRPGERYPAEYAGPHGKGLKALGLTLGDLDQDDE